jgi:hypothetical protein
MKLHLIILAGLLAAALPARAVLVNSAVAIPAPTVTVDFEAYDGFQTSGPVVLSTAVTFTGDAGSELGAFNRDLGANGLWGVGNRFAASGFVGELRFTFAALSGGAGAFVNHFADGVLPFAVVVSAYGDNNQIIETHTISVNTAVDGYNDGLFLGIARSEADIRSLSFKGVGAVVDNLSIAVPVPEPQTYALMLGGLGLVGWLARRRG